MEFGTELDSVGLMYTLVNTKKHVETAVWPAQGEFQCTGRA